MAIVDPLFVNLYDIIMIIVGIWFGYTNPGREDRIGIFKKGLKIGLTIGLIIGLLGFFFGGIFVALALGTVGIIAFLIIALRVTVDFVIGTFIGDLLEEKLKK